MAARNHVVCFAVFTYLPPRFLLTLHHVFYASAALLYAAAAVLLLVGLGRGRMDVACALPRFFQDGCTRRVA